jgi:phage anti-repressor protein
MHNEEQTIKALLQVKQDDYNGQTIQTTNAESLHKFLEVKTPFHKWIQKRVAEYELRLEIDFWTFLSETNGRPKTEYYLSLDTAKELSMVERGEKGKQARKYFIEAEKKLKEVVQKQEPKQIELGEQTAKFFNNLLEDISRYSPTARQTVGADIAKKIYGIELPHTALPPADERFTATQIAILLNKEFDTSHFNYNNIGRLTTKLNLKRQPYAVRRLTVAKDTRKEVEQYHYSNQAIDKIKEFLTTVN